MAGICDDNPPTEESICELLAKIAPGSLLLSIELLPGSYSNFTHLVFVRQPNNSEVRFVVRRYAVFGSYDRGEKARREYQTLQLLQKSVVPVPEPIYLDDTGDILGSPGIVTRYVRGGQISSPADPVSWARTLAVTLANIHAVPCDKIARGFLLDANREATWFVRRGIVPDYMQPHSDGHPDGPAVWQAVFERWPKLEPVPQGLVHLDYWPGNILWGEGERISAVIDWEEAAYGDPAMDVAYCRMEMTLGGLGHVADVFLGAYEETMGRPVVNLRFWELAAAARPMFAPQGWIDASPARERFREFVAEAMGKMTA